MATNTNLTAPISRDDLSIQVAATTGFAVGNFIVIDGETMKQSAPALGLVVPVQRGGQEGSAQVAHANLASVSVFTPMESAKPAPGQIIARPASAGASVSYSADGALPVPMVDTLILLTKGSVQTVSLAAPGPACPDGTEVTVMSGTAFAHVLTVFTKTATFAAAAGNNIVLIASRGLWSQKSISGVAVT